MSEKNGHKPVKRNKQASKSAPAVLADPKATAIEQIKEKFIAVLEKNGGNVSGALIATGLKRNSAYDHFKKDDEFANKWLNALEVATDDLFTEARRRASEGWLEPVFHNGERVADVRKYSDTLLIFLLKQGEAQKKWRNRITQTGNMALEAVRKKGTDLGLTEDQITGLQADMLAKFEKISLI